MNQDYMMAKLKEKDVEEALCLVWKVFLVYEAPDYSAEGIEEFRRFIDPDLFKVKLLSCEFRGWVCFCNNSVVGVLAARPPGHISLLFVDSDHHGQGIARALVNCMEDGYREGRGLAEITVNASPYAKDIYRKLGFCQTDAEQTVKGIRFIPMKRSL